jgi:O-antigen ligase
MKVWFLNINKNHLWLPVIHLIICLATQFQLLGLINDWRWLLLIAIDYPLSILMMMLSSVMGLFFSFAILGTIWWFALGVLVPKLFRYLIGIYRHTKTDR